jgi:hypothetical protein
MTYFSPIVQEISQGSATSQAHGIYVNLSQEERHRAQINLPV